MTAEQFPPIAHRHDPWTSQAAADAHIATGKRANHLKLCIDALTATPGLTADEVGTATKLGHIEAQRRLSDLKNKGIVGINGAKPSKRSGRAMSRWWLVRKPTQLELL